MKQTLTLFSKIVNKLLDQETQEPIAKHIPSKQLFNTLDLELPDNPTNESDFNNSLYELVKHTPKTGTNRFFNQLFGGRNQHAVLGDLLAVYLNNSMYTYKAAGPQIGVEKAILNKVIQMIGWDQNAGGTFASGGSMTNFMAMLMARDSTQENIREQGFSNHKLTVYTSTDSHYSVPKNAAFSGIGRDQVRYIKTDQFGKLIPQELEAAITKDIADGYIPCLVNLTAGTTVMGSFDPIAPVAELCKAHNVWLHVDGAYCGSVLFSKANKHLIAGIEHVDSFSFNAHKMLSTPLTCSLILVKDKGHLYDSFSNEASYLYQTDQDEFNLGKTSLQCGRRNDALKLWTLWKRVGTKGLEAIVDQQFKLADAARSYIRSNPDYTLYSYDDSVSICFNYKGIPAPLLCTELFEQSELQVGYGQFNGDEFIRLVTVNAGNSEDDILNFFKILEGFVLNNEALLFKPNRA